MEKWKQHSWRMLTITKRVFLSMSLLLIAQYHIRFLFDMGLSHLNLFILLNQFQLAIKRTVFGNNA